jgi:hypothetical protein
MDIQKRDGETQSDYIKRIVNGILVDKTIPTSEYESLSELLFGDGNCFNSSEVRKRCYGIKAYLEAQEKSKVDTIADKSILDEYELKMIELKKEKVKLQTTKLEFNKMIRQDARFEEFWDRVSQSIETVEVPIFEEFESIGGCEKVGLVGLSDIHFGKIFTSYNNAYSADICKDRLNALMNEIIEWVKDRNIGELHILNCSDNLEGLLRISQIRVLEMGVIDSAIEFGRLMAEWLNNLSKFIPITYHHVKSSNHTEIRFLNVKAGQFPDEDLEKIIINYIHDVLKLNNRITIPLYNSEYAVFTINGRNIVAAHGHQWRGKKPEVILKELRMLLKIEIHILVIGHLHHDAMYTVGEDELGNVKVIILPSLMGSDSFSDALLTGAKAGATLIEFNSNKKGITSTEVILN